MKEYQYYVFISYKSEDGKWAKWLQEKLEYFKLPSSTKDDTIEYIRPVFRDKTDLKPGILPKRINEALDQSKYLIAICSPHYSKSPWCDAEIRRLIETGKIARIIPFIIEGKPYSGDDNECFPPSLCELRGGGHELLGADIRPISSEYAFVQVVASMLDLNVDTLWKRYLKNEEEEKRKLKELNDHLFCLQSRIVSGKAKELINNWPYDNKKATALALNVLPNDVNYPNRPWVPEAEYVLRKVTTIILEKTKIDDLGGVICYTENTAILYGTKGPIIEPNSWSPDLTIRVFDIKTNTLKFILSNNKNIKYAALSSDSDLLATITYDDLSLWDLRCGKLLYSRICHDSTNKIISFSKDNKFVIVASHNYIEIWDTVSMEKRHQYQAHNGKIISLDISPDNRYVLTSSLDHTVKIWALDGATLEYSITYDSPVNCSCFSGNGSLIISAISEKTGENDTRHTIQIIDYKDKKKQKTIILSESTWYIKSICHYEESSYLLIEDISSSVYIYDIDTGIRIFDCHDSRMMKTYNKGNRIEVINNGTIIKQFDVLSRQELLELANRQLVNYSLSDEDKKEYYIT